MKINKKISRFARKLLIKDSLLPDQVFDDHLPFWQLFVHYFLQIRVLLPDHPYLYAQVIDLL